MKGTGGIMAGAKNRTPAKPKKSRRRAKAHEPKSNKLPYHAFWSGSLSFGLVSVPVLVFPANRDSTVHLRLLSPEGSFLERRFFCPRDGKEVSDDQIVRGYELDDGSYVIVEDRELEALEPQKSREIDLRQFVDLDELPPMLLERGYYLTPLQGATRAYRLLAEAMERQRRAGIATFVMREREYMVAIFAREGILCAETLRFHDEIREPATIGLPEPSSAPKRLVAAFERSIAALSAKTFSRTELADKTAESLRALIEKKRKAGRGVLRTDQHSGRAEPAAVGDVDLLETIRRSLRQAQGDPLEDPRARSSSRTGLRGKSVAKRR
jgi:DNA end-binding protein Ku